MEEKPNEKIQKSFQEYSWKESIDSTIKFLIEKSPENILMVNDLGLLSSVQQEEYKNLIQTERNKQRQIEKLTKQKNRNNTIIRWFLKIVLGFLGTLPILVNPLIGVFLSLCGFFAPDIIEFTMNRIDNIK